MAFFGHHNRVMDKLGKRPAFGRCHHLTQVLLGRIECRHESIRRSILELTTADL
ncbi:MAG TPA: hypothetical protein PLF81_09080 [Candidatus Anammoximicrobium sp.]|nr:hypothetical protein [Candidatus Anammoximicrobium sp.]